MTHGTPSAGVGIAAPDAPITPATPPKARSLSPAKTSDLRDRFAMEAMGSMLERALGNDPSGWFHTIASRAYQMADLMLVARTGGAA